MKIKLCVLVRFAVKCHDPIGFKCSRSQWNLQRISCYVLTPTHSADFYSAGWLEKLPRKSGGSHTDVYILTYSLSSEGPEVLWSSVHVWKQLKTELDSLWITFEFQMCRLYSTWFRLRLLSILRETRWGRLFEARCSLGMPSFLWLKVHL